METNAMEVKNLSFSYGSNQILSDISLTIPRGKITTIMGANGCGKSTLFSLMTKNLTPGKGKILLEEKSIKKYSMKCRRSLPVTITIPPNLLQLHILAKFQV